MTASGSTVEWAVGNESESVHIAVPRKPQTMDIRAPSHPGTEGGGSALRQAVRASDMPFPAKGWKGLSLSPFCTVLLRYVVPRRLAQLVTRATASLLASFRSM